MTIHTKHRHGHRALDVFPLYEGVADGRIPRAHLGELPMRVDLAAAIVADELLLDGNARLNLATFCATVGESAIDALAAQSARVNITNQDEYPASVEIERRLCAIVANLWHAPPDYAAVATTGSSEAILLSVLAARQRYREAGGTGTANLVYSAASHPCWDKACRYFDVEPRRLPVPRIPNAPLLETDAVLGAVDADTIAVAATLGYPSTGAFDDVAALARALDGLAARGGPDVGLHVDAASGGFLAPFSHPQLVWDFQLDRVVSKRAGSFPSSAWPPVPRTSRWPASPVARGCLSTSLASWQRTSRPRSQLWTHTPASTRPPPSGASTKPDRSSKGGSATPRRLSAGFRRLRPACRSARPVPDAASTAISGRRFPPAARHPPPGRRTRPGVSAC